jgi:uncharacterized RDD family membrane protein YckC
VEAAPERAARPASDSNQQALFSAPWTDPRVIPFDRLTTQAEKESIRARAANLARPAPLKTSKVEVRHAGPGNVRPRSTGATDQRRLEFLGDPEALPQSKSNIICDAPVAPAALRLEAAAIDGLLIAIGCAFGTVLFKVMGGNFSIDRHIAPFFALALLTVPLFYKVLWTLMLHDTPGMWCAGLRLVDFDGNPPSPERRYQRLAGSILSLLAGAMGLIWALVDEEKLTWHDHISSTFPTIVSEN